jgi:hypothetical protein
MNLQLRLRHECLEALPELLSNFQVILFSFYSEKNTIAVVDFIRD